MCNESIISRSLHYVCSTIWVFESGFWPEGREGMGGPAEEKRTPFDAQNSGQREENDFPKCVDILYCV